MLDIDLGCCCRRVHESSSTWVANPEFARTEVHLMFHRETASDNQKSEMRFTFFIQVPIITAMASPSKPSNETDDSSNVRSAAWSSATQHAASHAGYPGVFRRIEPERPTGR